MLFLRKRQRDICIKSHKEVWSIAHDFIEQFGVPLSCYGEMRDAVFYVVICRTVFLFYCMTNEQVWKMPAMWYDDSVSQNRYVKLTGTWNLCWRAKFLEGLTGSVCFLIRPSTSGGSSPECSRRKWPHILMFLSSAFGIFQTVFSLAWKKRRFCI